ncbi:MAG: hypothetical protein M5U01_28150 [Ardenticatenaceae bacterium]|nr:hypothetical protein [Ardenticatenaceae bacterium]HBY98942.1 hypothetical protein [Chloroflexota bacterium]
MSHLDRLALERLRYRQGQMLRSQDFRDQVALEAQLRWWHNRALHNTFGIAEGLEVALDPQGQALIVCPGLAYDCFGRELILRREQRLRIPPVTQRMTLLARYRETGSFPRKDELAAVCIPGRSPLLEEQPEFVWKASNSLDIRDGVPLAQIPYETTVTLEQLPAEVASSGALEGNLQYDGDKKRLIFRGIMTTNDRDKLLELSSDQTFQQAVQDLYTQSQISTTGRQLARPEARPRLGSGATIPGSTPWQLWELTMLQGTVTLGFQVKIDTSAAGFTEVPCYFAWLQGPLWNPRDKQLLPAPLEHIDAASISGFTFRLLMPTMPVLSLGERGGEVANDDFENRFLAFAQKQKLFVCWLGIQPGPTPVWSSTCSEVTHEHS